MKMIRILLVVGLAIVSSCSQIPKNVETVVAPWRFFDGKRIVFDPELKKHYELPEKTSLGKKPTGVKLVRFGSRELFVQNSPHLQTANRKGKTVVRNPYESIKQPWIEVPQAFSVGELMKYIDEGGQERYFHVGWNEEVFTARLEQYRSLDALRKQKREKASSGDTLDGLMRGFAGLAGAYAFAESGASADTISGFAVDYTRATSSDEGLLDVMGQRQVVGSRGSELQGTWENQEKGITFHFSNGSGYYSQWKPINGNPGQVITSFDYTVDPDRTMMTLHKKKIELRGAAGYDQEKKLDAKSRNVIQVNGNTLRIDQVTFQRK